MVAHRLSTIKRADNIVVLSHGSVVEQGKHDALMSQNGRYARMVEKQDGSDAENSIYDASGEGPRAGKAGTVEGSESGGTMAYEVNEPSEIVEAIPERKLNVSNRSEIAFWGLMKLVYRLIGSEHWIICIGLCSSVIVGLGTPVYVTAVIASSIASNINANTD